MNIASMKKRVTTMLNIVVCMLPGLLLADSLDDAMSGEQNRQAAVASAHPLATEAGIAILRAGGNAFDAAVAVSAALGVVEPAGSGFGGGGFFLLHRESDNKQTMVDAREKHPRRLHRICIWMTLEISIALAR